MILLIIGAQNIPEFCAAQALKEEKPTLDIIDSNAVISAQDLNISLAGSSSTKGKGIRSMGCYRTYLIT